MNEGRTGITGDQGKYEFPDAPPGRYNLEVSAAGFVWTSRAIVLSAGDHLRADIKLAPAASVSGRILDPEGNPVEHAYVVLWNEVWDTGKPEFRPAIVESGTGDALSAADGSYSFEGVRAGRYYVSASIEENERREPEGLVPTLHPAATDIASAVPLVISDQASLQVIDVRMRREETYSIHGTAIDGVTGKPASGVTVTIEREGLPEIDRQTTSGLDGSFNIAGLPPGAYTAVARNKDDIAVAGVLPVIISRSDLRNAILRLTGNIEVPVTVASSPDGSPLPANFTVSLDPDDFAAEHKSSPGAASFVLGDLPRRPHRIRIDNLPEGYYAESIRFGNRGVSEGRVDLSSGPAPLEITLAATAAVVDGTTKDAAGDPSPGAWVTLWPSKPGSETPQANVQADAAGRFHFAHLAPGDYYVISWEEVLRDQMNQNPAFLARFASDATAVSLDESSRMNIEVKTISHPRVVAEYANIP